MAISIIVAISLFKKKIENLIYRYIRVIWKFSWVVFIIFLVYVLLSRNRDFCKKKVGIGIVQVVICSKIYLKRKIKILCYDNIFLILLGNEFI